MKKNLFIDFVVTIMLSTIFIACEKEQYCKQCNEIRKPLLLNNSIEQTKICSSRQEINVRLTPVGLLSKARYGVVAGAAGNKILFAGGWIPGAHSSRVDIYDVLTQVWTSSELTVAERDGMAVGSVGTKVFFAGGGNNDWIDVTSRIDIYDAVTNSWSTEELSVPRKYLAAATIGNKILFAGGATWGPLTPGSQQNYLVGTNVVDVYDNSTNTWSTTALSEGRYELSATALGNKVYFGGGLHSMFTASNKVDIYDTVTSKWTTSQLQEPKASPASVAIGNKIFWGAGATTSYQAGYKLSKLVEIVDPVANVIQVDCITPKSMFQAVKKNAYVIFFTGYNNGPGKNIDIYNTDTDTWSTGVLPVNISGSAIISVNNKVYVAGGKVNGIYSSQVWELDF